MKTNNTVRISNDAYLTSNGNHFHGCCKPVIAIEINKVFNSELDAAEYFGVPATKVSAVLRGVQKTLGLWERDENGNRIHKICMCHLKFASDATSAMEMVMKNGRKTNEELSKAKERLAADSKKANAYDNIKSAAAHLSQLKAKRDKLNAEIAEAEWKLNVLLEGNENG
ncbi:MAG: hypothetical protein MR912_12110 [Prevotella sp.]|nr:hypothetical protein [Prevotella sp.]